MSDTNLYWALRGTYDERRTALASADRAWLEASLLDAPYNDFLSSRADCRVGEPDRHGHGKRIPYIGWFWRHVAFSDLAHIPIGDCGEFVGFMENNKWDYPQRYMTECESRQVVALIDEAMRLASEGGSVEEIAERTNAKLDELWDYMQTLEVA